MAVVELVLFFGPPFVGKTFYYYKHYSLTHSRISAAEIIEEDPNSSLRLVILKAIALLSKGNSVVIDDGNWYTGTRKSYSCLVKQKVPNCKLTIAQFFPDVTLGRQICLWAREWALVHWSHLKSGHARRCLRLPSSADQLDCWFAKKVISLFNHNPMEFPTPDEGFSLVTVEPEFICNTPYKFTLPGLFVQWESIIMDIHASSLSYKTEIPDILNEWFNKNPSGRVIIVGLIKFRCSEEILDERIKLVLLQLASQVSAPIFFSFIDVENQHDEFSVLPRPGVIAFQQRFHTIDLYHKSSMYIYHSEEHYKAANSAGIRPVKSEKLFVNPQLVNAIYCGETSKTLPFLKDIEELNCGPPSSDQEDPWIHDEAPIPFLSRARRSASPLVWKYCYGKMNGICFKDKLTLERYQTQYALAAQPTSSPAPAKRASPEPNTHGKSTSDNPDNTVSVRPSALGSNMKASFSLKNIDLREVAASPQRYRKGLAYKDRIFNFNVVVLDGRLKITAKCKGTEALEYDVEATVSDSTGLVGAHCSCPDPAGEIGRCKHVITLLLKFQERNEVEKQRKKPSPVEQPKKLISKGVQTLYCMSREELLETARDVLKEHEESLAQGLRKPAIQKPEEPTGISGQSDSMEVVLVQERTVEKRDCESNVLEELMFGHSDDNEKCHKRICTGTISSFAKETPPDVLPSSEKDQHRRISAIIPDSLVPETVSLIPETMLSGSQSSPHEGASSRSDKSLMVERNQSFEDFLDDLI